ncbi:MAG: acid-shock protein [Providencia heimbachae]|nr:acid-shock protein [Providencia heimbachae]
MKKLLTIVTVLSFAVSGAALANSTIKSEPIAPVAKSHQTAKVHQQKTKIEKKGIKQNKESASNAASTLK